MILSFPIWRTFPNHFKCLSSTLTCIDSNCSCYLLVLFFILSSLVFKYLISIAFTLDLCFSFKNHSRTSLQVSLPSLSFPFNVFGYLSVTKELSFHRVKHSFIPFPSFHQSLCLFSHFLRVFNNKLSKYLKMFIYPNLLSFSSTLWVVSPFTNIMFSSSSDFLPYSPLLCSGLSSSTGDVLQYPPLWPPRQ